MTQPNPWTHATAHLPTAHIHYVRAGQGRPVFLLHGWPEFWWTWHRVLPALAEKFDVIVPDLRGFGDSRATGASLAESPGAATHAGDILALADILGLDRFGIASHDVGAYIAQHIARTTPERLTGLFFFNAPYPGIGRRWVDAHHVQEIWYQSFHQLPWAAQLVGHSRETCRIYFENMLHHWAHRPGTFDGLIEPWVDNFMKPGNIEGGFAWYAATHAARMALVQHDAPNLPKITTPSRFFWGRHDPILRSDWTDRLPDYFENPFIELAENAGHFVHLETPEAASTRMIEFFSGK